MLGLLRNRWKIFVRLLACSLDSSVSFVGHLVFTCVECNICLWIFLVEKCLQIRLNQQLNTEKCAVHHLTCCCRLFLLRYYVWQIYTLYYACPSLVYDRFSTLSSYRFVVGCCCCCCVKYTTCETVCLNNTFELWTTESISECDQN